MVPSTHSRTYMIMFFKSKRAVLVRALEFLSLTPLSKDRFIFENKKYAGMNMPMF